MAASGYHESDPRIDALLDEICRLKELNAILIDELTQKELVS